MHERVSRGREKRIGMSGEDDDDDAWLSFNVL